jgi:hypothetical protein
MINFNCNKFLKDSIIFIGRILIIILIIIASISLIYALAAYFTYLIDPKIYNNYVKISHKSVGLSMGRIYSTVMLAICGFTIAGFVFRFIFNAIFGFLRRRDYITIDGYSGSLLERIIYWLLY